MAPGLATDAPLFQGLDGRWEGRRAFAAEVAQLAARLPRVPALAAGTEDRRLFAQLLLAAGLNGTALWLTPPLDDPGVPVIDPAAWRERPRLRAVARLAAGDWAAGLDPDGVAVVAQTSGSTAAPRAEAKTWGMLVSTARAAVAGPQSLFGAPAPIVATVPPGHMYGLETGVLMPLFAGFAAQAGRPFFPADVRAALQQAGSHGAPVLVTTPSHLRTLVAAGGPWPALERLVSATAPLDAGLVRRAEAEFAAPLFELYGCTEAGSLATRRPAVDEAWTPYADCTVHIDAEHQAVVAGARLPRPVRLADRLAAGPRAGSFRLLGRCTDLIKVGGKRISLEDLSRRLLAVPGVDDAVVFVPEPARAVAPGADAASNDGAHDGGEARPAALVVSRLPAREVARRLALSPGLDPVFVPRPLRVVPSLPRNALGKLPRASLLAALGAPRGVGLVAPDPDAPGPDAPSPDAPGGGDPGDAATSRPRRTGVAS